MGITTVRQVTTTEVWRDRRKEKLLSQTRWWIASSTDRQTAQDTYFYKKLTERTPDIQACSLLSLGSRADSALYFPLPGVELFHAFMLIIHSPLLSFLTGRLNVCSSGLEAGRMLNSLLQSSPALRVSYRGDCLWGRFFPFTGPSDGYPKECVLLGSWRQRSLYWLNTQ